MPKNKKKRDLKPGKSSNSRAQSGDDNSEVNADDNASTISNTSTAMSYQQDLDSNEDLNSKVKPADDLLEKIDNIDAQINSCLDGLLEKGFKEREESLKILKKLFSNKYLVEHLNSKRFTLTDSLLKSLKRGKLNEQILAAEVIMLTFIQLGHSADASDLLNESRSILIEIIEGEENEPDVRAVCTKCLGLAIFVTNENSTDTLAILDKFESLFSRYVKGDGTLRLLTPKMYELQNASLSTWCLLLCILPLPLVNKIAQKHVKHFLEFLKSPDVDLRIIAGETIAFLFDLAQFDSHSDLSCFEDDDLIETLKDLASDSSKHRSKKDKKHQRSSFRDVLRTIEEGEFETQAIKFASENLYLDNWIRRKQYETFCDLLGTGMNTHLQENEFIREIFNLGPPSLNSDAIRKSNLASKNRLEKAQFNREQFRTRTKSMKKKRDNKDLAHGGDDDE